MDYYTSTMYYSCLLVGTIHTLNLNIEGREGQKRHVPCPFFAGLLVCQFASTNFYGHNLRTAARRQHTTHHRILAIRFDLNMEKHKIQAIKTFVRPTVILIYHRHSTSTNSHCRKSINSSFIDKKSL